MPCCKGQDYDRMFDAKTAAKELRAYRKKGPRGVTLRLLKAVRSVLKTEKTSDFTHLDIGGGVGVLQHELAESGSTRTTAVDASRPYLDLLRTAAEERGYASRQVTVEGDFTEVASDVDPSTVVTLDKVICCYPDMPALVRASAVKATAIYGISIPSDAAWVGFAARIANWFMRTVLRWDFQGYIYAHAAIDAICAEQGLTLAKNDPGALLCIRVYRREPS